MNQRQQTETERSIRVGMRTRDVSASRLRYLKQVGISDVLVDPSASEGPDALTFTGERAPTVAELAAVRDRMADLGQRFHAVHSIPISAYDRIMFGDPGKDEQLETLKQFVRNLGEVGVPILGYKWMAVDIQRTTERRVRGGARATAFDGDRTDGVPGDPGAAARDVTEAELWDNYEAFVEEIVPVAESAGVRLAVHPADPPVYERLHGIPSLFRNRDDFERVMAMDERPHHGIKLCLGCFSEMGADVYDAARHFVERDEVGFVHFRDVVGTVPRFHETFLDDTESNYDEYRMLETLADAGYRGAVLPDHVPRVEGDEPWNPDPDDPARSVSTPIGGPRSRAYGAGYIRGMLRALASGRSTI